MNEHTVESNPKLSTALQSVTMSGDRIGRRKPNEGNRHDRDANSAPVSNCQFPLRMLVSRESVGAIIGRGGSTIRNITRETKARVDVNRKEYNSSDKAVTIYGTPESQSDACQRILSVMIEEISLTATQEEVALKILAHDDLVGRLIGKEGQTIKKIMKDSGTKINVSSLSQLSGDNVDRVITIQGTVQGMILAERLVSERLRKSFNDDLNVGSVPCYPTASPSPTHIPTSFAPSHAMTLNNTSSSMGFGIDAQTRNPFIPWGVEEVPPVASCSDWGGGYGAVEQLNEKETVRVPVPVSAIGAIIGRKGSSIRNIKWISGASVKVSSGPSLDGSGEEDKNAIREITITGYPEQQWKAQSLIYDKMKSDNTQSADPKFVVEMTVSNSKVGKLIGKRGGNIKELTARTGARIVIENDAKSTGVVIPDVACSGVPIVSSAAIKGPSLAKCVRISGSFNAVQLAQRQIRSLLSLHLFRPARKVIIPTARSAGALRLDSKTSNPNDLAVTSEE
ncbi:unnamed protein product [Allacma fusca]|uniref:K Homology domain-containing protein n=1 Tax=Allacma fusca TaxID=39272 RepID=A0A8J2LER2_9HEXA|nr:unnamed protein product [Allacma fusca]